MSTGAPTENGTAIRYPSAALLCVDSADGEQYNTQGFRVGNNTPANIYINKQQTLMFGYMTRVALTEVNIQWDIPNVNETNNTLTITEYNSSGVLIATRRIVLDAAWYGLPELAYEIQQALDNAAGYTVLNGPFVGTYEVTVDGEPLTGATASSTVTITNPVISIARTDGGFFQITPYNASATLTGLPALQDDLTNMLGLTPTIQGGSNAPYDTVNGSYASAQYTPYFDIVSNLLTKNQNVSDNSSAKRSTGSKLARIYLSNEQIEKRTITITYNGSGDFETSTDSAIGTSPFVFRREFRMPKQIQWNKTENIDVIDLQCIDYRGNQLPIDPSVIRDGDAITIQNTADFQFTVMVSEV